MGKNSSHTPDVEIENRRAKIADLRRAGVSIRKIATALKISPAQVHKDLKAILSQIRKYTETSIEQMITMESDRLDEYLFRLNSEIEKGNVKAIAAAAKIVHQRSVLFGLYPAAKPPANPEPPTANTDKNLDEWKKRAGVQRAKAEALLAAYDEVESMLGGDLHDDE